MTWEDATKAKAEGADAVTQQQQQQTDSTAPTSSSTTSSTMESAPDQQLHRRRLKRPHSRSSTATATTATATTATASSLPLHTPKKKRLRWSTITVHEFGVGLGGSSVPGKGGPSIGLGDKPEFTWTTQVGHMAERVEGVHRFTPHERVQLLQRAGVSEGMIQRFSREANIINCSRRRTLVEDVAERKEAKRQRRRLQAPSAASRPCVAPFVHRPPHLIAVDYV
ncbi:unnamed protein product [Hyaloperonospora brassicae]|uniref:Homeobox domain-containing protein n=1 Tax=Hyaloperonospora brassicae TaxID=162125 RepID=A0AAV0TY15_HYABA|nr:unnamed protein product [Hyaloperonospora brassicae]CAI5729462.1 unnamed protein product [Hyaloperonospora brassicae]